MDLLSKVGGRKFIIAGLITLAAAAAEIFGPKGLSTELAALLGTIYATFSASNALITKKQMETSAAAEPQAALPPVDPMPELIQRLGPPLDLIGKELISLKEGQAEQAKVLEVLQGSVSNIQKGIAVVISSRQ